MVFERMFRIVTFFFVVARGIERVQFTKFNSGDGQGDFRFIHHRAWKLLDLCPGLIDNTVGNQVFIFVCRELDCVGQQLVD